MKFTGNLTIMTTFHFYWLLNLQRGFKSGTAKMLFHKQISLTKQPSQKMTIFQQANRKSSNLKLTEINPLQQRAHGCLQITTFSLQDTILDTSSFLIMLLVKLSTMFMPVSKELLQLWQTSTHHRLFVVIFQVMYLLLTRKPNKLQFRPLFLKKIESLHQLLLTTAFKLLVASPQATSTS